MRVQRSRRSHSYRSSVLQGREDGDWVHLCFEELRADENTVIFVIAPYHRSCAQLGTCAFAATTLDPLAFRCAAGGPMDGPDARDRVLVAASQMVTIDDDGVVDSKDASVMTVVTQAFEGRARICGDRSVGVRVARILAERAAGAVRRRAVQGASYQGRALASGEGEDPGTDLWKLLGETQLLYEADKAVGDGVAEHAPHGGRIDCVEMRARRSSASW